MPVNAKQLIAATAVALFYAATSVEADLRLASTPKNGFKTIQPNGNVQFVTTSAQYMEPSTFNYQGLINQKANNYDNFLRSNVDNEQDNRNFNKEAGRDMLPFRTLEAESVGATVTMEVGKQQIIPLRWNNPHSSECEFNVWVKATGGSDVVIPIKKPVCCGEGYGDGFITATIPADFNDLAAKVPGFNGCAKLGDCTLQLYGHSVEPRTYAVGVPLIVTGGAASTLPKATDMSMVQSYTTDPGLDLSKQPRDICLPSNSAEADVTSANPRYARLVSDVFNHAYQNSDYSPYSGQQQESISRNMQAATVLRMVPANRGELGQAILSNADKQYLQNLRNKVDGVVAKYEGAANNIINQLGREMATSATVGTQKTSNAFRAAEAGSVTTNRQQTATYIPSFQLPAARVQQVIQGLGNNVKSLVSPNGLVQIYVSALNEVKPDFEQAAARGFKHQPAVIKSSLATLSDATKFRKLDAEGKQDGGKYAATMAKAYLAAPTPAPKAPAPSPTPSPSTQPPAPAPAPADPNLPPINLGPVDPLAPNPDDSATQDDPLLDGEEETPSSAAMQSPAAVMLQAVVAMAAVYLKF